MCTVVGHSTNKKVIFYAEYSSLVIILQGLLSSFTGKRVIIYKNIQGWFIETQRSSISVQKGKLLAKEVILKKPSNTPSLWLYTSKLKVNLFLDAPLKDMLPQIYEPFVFGKSFITIKTSRFQRKIIPLNKWPPPPFFLLIFSMTNEDYSKLYC